MLCGFLSLSISFHVYALPVTQYNCENTDQSNRKSLISNHFFRCRTPLLCICFIFIIHKIRLSNFENQITQFRVQMIQFFSTWSSKMFVNGNFLADRNMIYRKQKNNRKMNVHEKQQMLGEKDWNFLYRFRTRNTKNIYNTHIHWSYECLSRMR